jgi:uncharacterized protein YkwD
MEGTIAMSGSGAGRRMTVALGALLLLACASGSLASDRNEGKEESASTVHRGIFSKKKQNTPSTESVSRTNPFSSSKDAKPYDGFSGVTTPTQEEKLLVELINVERSSRGLHPVAWDGMLSGVARIHCADMRSMGKATHDSSNDRATYSQRLGRTPYRARAAAENVAYNSNVVRAHRALMASPGHRKNILDPMMTAVGIGIVKDFKDDWIYVVEDFATPIANVSNEEAKRLMGESLARAKASLFGLPEDKALSKKLTSMAENMAEKGGIHAVPGSEVGVGWTLAFTALDPRYPPASALKQVEKADGYALGVTFRKTKKYPFGAYWAVLFLKGTY